MKTYKSKRTVCRGRASGKFANKGKCGMFKKTKVKALTHGFLFK
jgi:hypothetical protein